MVGSLPEKVRAALERMLAQAGAGRVRSLRPVSGGDISQAYHVVAEGGEYFLKYREGAPRGFFAAEARGLRLLAEAGAIRVPRVWGWEEDPALILLEWLPPPPRGADRDRAAAALGTGLARLHRVRGPAFGLGEDGFIGALPQPGGWFQDWPSCWRHRLATQADHAARRGRLAGERARRLERLLGRLEEWLEEDAGGPALLHGDLWGGNWMVGPAGEPVLIDPATFYGSREVDLAMTELFGGFPPAFYAAYQAEYPLPPGYEERRPLYQLYYLLVHLALFGEGYGTGVDRILRRYVG